MLFPASRGLYSFCVRWVDEHGKIKKTSAMGHCVESMRGGYNKTESSRDTLCCVGSINNSGITVK